MQIIIFINMQPNCCGKTVVMTKHRGVVLKVTDTKLLLFSSAWHKIICMFHNFIKYFLTHARAAEQEHRAVAAEHRNFRKSVLAATLLGDFAGVNASRSHSSA